MDCPCRPGGGHTLSIESVRPSVRPTRLPAEEEEPPPPPPCRFVGIYKRGQARRFAGGGKYVTRGAFEPSGEAPKLLAAPTESVHLFRCLPGKHGEWLRWLADNCPAISRGTAWAYMRVSANVQRVEHLSFREALKLLAAPKDEPEPSVHFSSQSQEWYTPLQPRGGRTAASVTKAAFSPARTSPAVPNFVMCPAHGRTQVAAHPGAACPRCVCRICGSARAKTSHHFCNRFPQRGRCQSWRAFRPF